MTSDYLLSSSSQLRPSDAVAALILVESDGYLMQLRDSRPDIWYPGYWGLFGGAIESGEDPIEALRRELREELELEMGEAKLFASLNYDLSSLGIERYCRNYYVVHIDELIRRKLVLHEGADMRVFTAEEIFREPRIAPYDSFVLFLHHARHRLSVPAPG